MTPREAAEQIWGKSHKYTHDDVEQIIQAACKEATRVRWTREKPTTTGKWWYREDGNCEYYVASVVGIEGDLFAAMDGSQFYVNDCEGEWSDKPMQEPE